MNLPLSKARFHTFALALTVLTLSGCATTGVNRGDFNIISTAEEVEMGKSISAEVESKYPLSDNEEIVAYVGEVGAKIVAICDRPDIAYSFKVIADRKQVNAFALPGGHIYVYEGLLLEASNEAELAAVLAHEVGHVVARHATERLSKLYGYSLLIRLILGEEPNRWAEVAANLFGTAGLLKFSREDEFEADGFAVTYTNSAGYKPVAVSEFLGKLKALEGREPGRLETLMMTHPPTSERIERADAQIRSLLSVSQEDFSDRYITRTSSLRDSE